MKRSLITLIALAAAAATVGCASSNEQYYAAMKEIEIAKAERAAATATAMLSMAATGDAMTKGMYMMWLASQGGKSGAAATTFAPPVDPALAWASVLVPGATNLASGYFGYKLGVANSEASVQMNAATMSTIGGVATSGFSSISNVAVEGINKPVFALPLPAATPTISGSGDAE